MFGRNFLQMHHEMVKAADGEPKSFKAVVRIDTPGEVLYYQHGGILQYVLRQLLDK